MYSRVRFSRWRQGLSGPPGGAALAGVLAGVLAVLLGIGAAGAFPSGTGARAAAANAAGPARPAGHPRPGSAGGRRRHVGLGRLSHLCAGQPRAGRQYPNLRIFDWAAAAQDGWFISDGIHYTPAGYAARAHLIARALARAFPRSGAAAGCVIS